jgi:septal ring factor EnvC (AmiA/AmiB activator)
MKSIIFSIIMVFAFASLHTGYATANTVAVSGEVTKPKIDISQVKKARLIREIKTTERKIATLKTQIARLENLMQTARMTQLALARNTKQLANAKLDLAKAELRLAELKRTLALL